MGDIERKWMLYPVRSEQIKAAGSDDVDHAEWVVRADGPLPGRPVEVVPASQLRGAVSSANLAASAILGAIAAREVKGISEAEAWSQVRRALRDLGGR